METLTQLPATLQALGMTGVLAVGILFLVKVWVVPKPLHDEVVRIYQRLLDESLALQKEQSGHISALVATQREILDAVRQLAPRLPVPGSHLDGKP